MDAAVFALMVGAAVGSAILATAHMSARQFRQRSASPVSASADQPDLFEDRPPREGSEVKGGHRVRTIVKHAKIVAREKA